MRNILLFQLILLLFVSCGTAQQGSYSVKSKKAIKLYEEAIERPRIAQNPRTGGPDYPGAIELMKKSIAIEPRFWEAHTLISEFYELTGDFKSATYHLEESLRIRPDQSPTGSVFFFLANLLKLEGRYVESNLRIDQFLSYQMGNPEMQDKAMEMKTSNTYAIYDMEHPVKYEPVNIGSGINTADPEYFPTITVDGRMILFTRRIEDNRVVGPYKEQEDFFIFALGKDKVWGKTVPKPNNVNNL